MTTFCTNCGSPVGEDQKFCSKCGASVGVSATISVPTTTTPVAAPATPLPLISVPSPSLPAPARGPIAIPQKGSAAVKIIVAIVGFLALVSVLAIGSCFYIGYKVRQRARSMMMNARTATTSTPEMHLSEGGPGSSAAAAATVDVPPYPGSTPTGKGGQLSAGLTGSASAQEYETDDSVDKVESFYKDKLGSKINIMGSQDNATFNFLTSQGMTTVTLTRDEGTGKTKINIARIGK